MAMMKPSHTARVYAVRTANNQAVRTVLLASLSPDELARVSKTRLAQLLGVSRWTLDRDLALVEMGRQRLAEFRHIVNFCLRPPVA